MSAETIGRAPRAKAFDTILLGGLIAGLLDGLDAVVFYGLSFGVTPTCFSKTSPAQYWDANIAGRLVHNPSGRRVPFHDCHRSSRGFLLGESCYPGALAEALDLWVGLRSIGVPLHALCRGFVIGGAQENRSSHCL